MNLSVVFQTLTNVQTKLHLVKPGMHEFVVTNINNKEIKKRKKEVAQLGTSVS